MTCWMSQELSAFCLEPLGDVLWGLLLEGGVEADFSGTELCCVARNP